MQANDTAAYYKEILNVYTNAAALLFVPVDKEHGPLNCVEFYSSNDHKFQGCNFGYFVGSEDKPLRAAWQVCCYFDKEYRLMPIKGFINSISPIIGREVGFFFYSLGCIQRQTILPPRYYNDFWVKFAKINIKANIHAAVIK